MSRAAIRIRRRVPRAIALRVGAAVVAVLTAQVVVHDLQTLERRTAALGPLGPSVVAAHDLELGRVVRASDLRTIERHQSQLIDGAITSPDDVIGHTLLVPLLAGAPVQAAAIAPADRDGTAALVAPGMQAIRLRADDALVPAVGDVVDVLATATNAVAPDLGLDDVTSDTMTEARVVADAARVLDVEEPDSTRSATVERAIAVTLLVTEQEARQVASARANGFVTLALDAPEEACCIDGSG